MSLELYLDGLSMKLLNLQEATLTTQRHDLAAGSNGDSLEFSVCLR
jgi:hypothetical protein